MLANAETARADVAVDSVVALDGLAELRHAPVAANEPLGYLLDAHHSRAFRDVRGARRHRLRGAGCVLWHRSGSGAAWRPAAVDAAISVPSPKWE